MYAIFYKAIDIYSSKKSGSYLQVENEKKSRRSWASAKLDVDWSPFVTHPCDNAVEKIWFEGPYCFTQCSVTKNIEKWIVENPEHKAKKLTLVQKILANKP